MGAQHKVLILDDDPDLLDLYREMLSRLPSKPEIHTATSGTQAIALLDSETFSLLVCDLNMPKMDGLQVLSIVRRKYPQLRTAVMTSVLDEQFRMRAYAMGVDLYLEKPNTSEGIKQFLDCIESLLGQENQGGFRGVQSKSLVDILQLEGLSRSSSTLKVTNGPLEGRIWFQNGEVIDATTLDLTGEAAFQKILTWKTGNFEVLPPDLDRKRTIVSSFQGLLLETAQVLDEANAESDAPKAAAKKPVSPLASMVGFRGVSFLLSLPLSGQKEPDVWGADNAERVVKWAQETWQSLNDLGDELETGPPVGVETVGFSRHVSMACREDVLLCVGFQAALAPEVIRETMRNIVLRWAS
jgi:CheY-like chemotaxis protein